MGKKTLYLDLDALEALKDALKRHPGKPSLSSYLSQQIPQMAEILNRVAAIRAASATREDLAVGINAFFDEALEVLVDAKGVAREYKNTPPKDGSVDVPASKPKRQKKSA
jgi:hypothetical protein